MFEFVFYNSTADPSSVIHPRTPVFTCLEYPVIKSIRVGEDIIKESICPRDAQQGLVFDLSAGSTGPARTQESRNLTAQLHCLWTKVFSGVSRRSARQQPSQKGQNNLSPRKPFPPGHIP
uniref:(northern house mosquito) hypothetical protein n=1 Tax=Culex pipiens TaxID=7175 RepID=A0A8D8G1G8_CULPI